MTQSKAPQCPLHKKPMTPSTIRPRYNQSDVPVAIDLNWPNSPEIAWVCSDCATSSLTDYLQMIEEYAEKTGKTLEELTEDPFID